MNKKHRNSSSITRLWCRYWSQTLTFHHQAQQFYIGQYFHLPPVFEKRREVLFWGPSPSPPSPRTCRLISRLLLKLVVWNLPCAILCKNNIAKMFLDFFKIWNCSFDRCFLNFWLKIFCARNLKNCWVDFHNICNADTSKLLDVQCKFMFQLDRKILAQACPGWGDGIDPEFFV